MEFLNNLISALIAGVILMSAFIVICFIVGVVNKVTNGKVAKLIEKMYGDKEDEDSIS